MGERQGQGENVASVRRVLVPAKGGGVCGLCREFGTTPAAGAGLPAGVRAAAELS